MKRKVILDFLKEFDTTILSEKVEEFDTERFGKYLHINGYDDEERIVLSYFIGNEKTIISSEYQSDDIFEMIFDNSVGIKSMTNIFWSKYNNMK